MAKTGDSTLDRIEKLERQVRELQALKAENNRLKGALAERARIDDWLPNSEIFDLLPRC
jgi:hypothetical protein